jgi:hypothetical protein
MPRYFFHLINGRAVLDLVGTDLPDHSEARMHAIAQTTQMMSEPDATWKGEDCTMLVTKDDGDLILTLKFSANFGTVH